MARAGIIVIVLCLLIALAALVAQVAGSVGARSTFTALRPPARPPFLNGLHQIWADDASQPDPVQANRWGEYACQRKDGQEEKSHSVRARTRTFHGAPHGSTARQTLLRLLRAPGRNIWTPGTAGRCELAYPGPNSARRRSHGPRRVWFSEGDHRVILFSSRVPLGWDINASNWQGVGRSRSTRT